jgi:amino acid permease
MSGRQPREYSALLREERAPSYRVDLAPPTEETTTTGVHQSATPALLHGEELHVYAHGSFPGSGPSPFSDTPIEHEASSTSARASLLGKRVTASPSSHSFTSALSASPSSLNLAGEASASPSESDAPTAALLAGLGEGSLLSCSAALTTTILGAGVLGLPHAMAECGYLLGAFLLTLAGVAAAFALHLLATSAQTVNIWPSSFYTTATAAVPRAAWLIDLAVAMKCFGVACSFLIVIGDLLPDAMRTFLGEEAVAAATGFNALLLQRRFWILLYVITIVGPLSCLRSLHALRFTAVAGVGFVCFLVLIVFLYAVDGGSSFFDACAGLALDTCRGDAVLVTTSFGTLKILSIFIFGYTCHQNIFTICNELHDFTLPRVNTVIRSSLGVAYTVYILIACLAYHTYGARIHGNVLTNYPDNYLLAFARILIATNCAFTFALQCNPCRNSISLLMHQWKHRKDIGTSNKVEPHSPSEVRITVLTALIVAGTTGVAMLVTDLGVVLSIVGATGSTTISYILPGMIFLKLHPVWTPKHNAAATLLTMGCIIIPSCLIFIFI